MTAISRRIAVLSACLLALAGLSACTHGGLPEARIGNLEIDRYVALGDGYASAPYTGATDPAKGCLRSSDDYPALLAKDLKAKDFVDVTCLFASSQDITRSSTPARGKKGPVPAQLDAVAAGTDLVTLTVGLSDRDFASRLFEMCVADCVGAEVQTEDIVNDLGQIGASIRDTVQAVADKAPDARLYVVGYPQLLPRSGSCDRMPELSQTQVDAINSAIFQLNDHLRTAARAAGGDFLDVSALSQGHDMCADDPWVTGVETVDGGPPRYHPKPALNQAIAKALATELKP